VRRRAAALGRERIAARAHVGAELLPSPRHVQRLRGVAEVAPDLALDRRDGVGGEGNTTARVEAVDRLDQPDDADLHQVVERLAPPGEARCQRAHERQVPLDQLPASLGVAALAPCLHQSP
jgi:hypothetical protein